MKVILIRHTESFGNKQKVYAGVTDFDLTERGLSQIGDVITQFTKMIDPTSHYTLYSSPLRRCTLLSERRTRLHKTRKLDRCNSTNDRLVR